MTASTMPAPSTALAVVPRAAPAAPRPLPLRASGFTVLLIALPILLAADRFLYRPGHDPLEWYVTLAWALPILVSVSAVAGVFRSRRIIRAAATAPTPGTCPARLTITIPTAGRLDGMPALRRVVTSARESFGPLFGALRIEVVMDEGAPARSAIRALIPDAVVIPVPAGYATPAGAICKARAAQFALEARTAVGWSGPDAWVLHLDDDTGVEADTAAEIARFITANPGRAGKHLAQGVLTYPRHLSASRFTWLADSIRPADDVTRFAAFTGSGTPITGLHGELMLVRASVEADLGWDYANEIVEDSRFALRFAERYPGRAGWFAARCYGSAPETARAFIRQRARWSNGLCRLAVNRSIPLRLRLFLGYCVSTWILGPLQNVLLIAGLAWLLREPNLSPVAWPVMIAWAVNMAVVVWQYHTGLRINAHAGGHARPTLADRILVTLGIPVFALMEGAGGFLGAARYAGQALARRQARFDMIAKSL
jgi:beta-1,4-mannosyltransferase